MPNEKQTDFIVAELLKNAGINFNFNGSEILEIQNALSTASKRGTNKKGFPEFTAVVKDFVIVIEDKAETKLQAKYLDEKTFLMDTKSITDYAENGALHYALNIIAKTNFKKIIAFGCSGTDEKKILIRPIFVSPTGYRILDRVKDFFQFSAQNIEKYYREIICQNESLEKVELQDILSRAGNLNENLRTYGQFSDLEKPLAVSAILLALAEPGFSTENLTGDTIKTDGEKIFDALSTHMDRVQVSPQTKKSKVLDQFRLIKNRPHLSNINKNLGKSPLKFFAEYLNSNILNAIVNNSPEDVLGRFYGEFISYSGEGQKLGVVLTPKHITELFCDLVKISPTDKVFDPCCGTGGFLIAAMSRMLNLAKNDSEKNFIKKNNLHGIDQRDDMFSIATTNMILRGDGKSNLICGDFFQTDLEELREKNFSVGFMNPPYNQKNYSEIEFISRLLDSLGENARCVVIVPQSIMVGKTKNDKAEKKFILENHTLEGVITLNPQTFYGVGTNPVIAVFTAHKPHPKEKLVKFVDFKNDGYEISPHLGLLATSAAPERKKFLLQCWHEGKPAPNSFIIRTEIKPDDEWLHSFYYFNEEIPTEKDFEKTMADYLTFEFNMIVHGRGYLFDDKKKNSPLTENNLSLENKTWKDFFIKDLFEIKATKSGIDKSKLKSGVEKFPYITRTDKNNGWDSFVCEQISQFDNENVLTVGLDTQTVFYQPTNFYTGQNIQVFSSINLNKYVGLFISPLLKIQMKKFNWGGNGATLTRLKAVKILLPVNEKGEPDWKFMENFMRQIENKLLKLYREFIEQRLKNDFVIPAEKKVWKEFFIGEIFEIQSGVRLTKNDMREGKIPFIGSTDSNNGITAWISNKNSSFDKNVLGVNYNGSVVENFYHPYEAIFSDDVKRFHLLNHEDDKYILLFIKNSILQQKIKFQYGYKFNAKRMARQKILLPVDEKNLPDWKYMENYMRAKENLLLKKYFDKKL